MSKWESYLTNEIAIEYKSCLYFFAFLFYICVHKLIHREYNISILLLAELILICYLMGYIQLYLLRNFDESDHFGIRELVYSLLCTGIYTTGSYLLNWLNKEWLPTLIFGIYTFIAFIGMYLINKVKREIDTKRLNEDLIKFKNRGNSL